MKADIAAELGAQQRQVETVVQDGRPARAVVATRNYSTPVEDVWDALTNPERLPRWFLPVSGELRVGGRYQLEGNAGGTITRCEPPRQLAMTWEYGGGMSWVEVSLDEDARGGTRLELRHVSHVDEKLWPQYGPGAVGVGWDLALLGLGQHLATGTTLDPAEAQAWAVSPEGKVFVRSSSDGWGEASIAAGTDAEEARAAAARTAAFYTGEGGEPTS
jgi:uncharacterized protein YndB with AHSA1/START domain